MTNDAEIRVPEALVRSLDALVDAGRFGSRADAVRSAVEMLLEKERSRSVGDRMVEGYRRTPQNDLDFPELPQAAVASISEEPW
jgi:Arc/MetJ-type ribon-helix-helix transcriptional regulator